MKLRTRVALAGGAVVVAALALVGAVEYPAVDYELRGQLDSSLSAMVQNAPNTFDAVEQKAARAEELGEENPLKGSGVDIEVGTGKIQLVLDPVLTPASDFAELTARDIAVAAGTAGPYYENAVFDGSTYRVYAAPLPGRPHSLVRAARLESDPTPVLNRLALLLLILTPTAGLVAVVAARLLAGRVLRPVGVLTSAVERITETGDLTTPAELRAAAGGRTRDEVGRLGRAFTAMTEALDGSIGAQRRLVADASHELRTPLTSLTTNLELLSENPADPASPALLADALEQARELKVLINDLVDLARFGEAAARAEPVRLDLVAEEVAESRGVPVRAEAAVVHGDPDALERALANLVDNAVKFSGMRGVGVTVVVRGGGAVVEVRDEGPGIPAADLPYIFDRFHRSSAARALPGSGLGLAIVKQIADAHGGRVEAVAVERGALLRLTLPLGAGLAEPVGY